MIQIATELAGLSNLNQVDIPAVKPPLIKYLEGAIQTSTWEYRSIIGLLNYISGSSRSDIAQHIQPQDFQPIQRLHTIRE